jgi:hypothetical protein
MHVGTLAGLFPMTSVQLSNLDARLAFLAVQYHVARPGSGLNRVTGQPLAHDLAEAGEELEPQLAQAVATIELSDNQRLQLISATAGAINELKATALLAAGGQSTVPAFRGALRMLFPEVGDDPEQATQLARHLLMLRRRLESMQPSSPAGGRTDNQSRWRFWKRTG